MRFFEDGPEIPDQLIEARDNGEVVFFCGAGISLPAGLPDFDRLARDLLDRLGAQESRQRYTDQASLDQVFTALVKEFGGSTVDREIASALATPRRPRLDHHRTALDLSRGPGGMPQIVTTNFDLLFERAERGVRTYVPPALPDLGLLQPIEGVVYLHGRLNTSTTQARAGYIISSADFGRAYLAEGWAARFVRELRERYTIVLLGYSANDPPMRYLLEGLNSREGTSYRFPLYAFAAADGGAAEEDWRDRGVTLIPYEPADPGHSGLWNSLEAWATAARQPDDWQSQLVALAQRKPTELKPFERGQVCHLIKSAEGARAFANAEPAPPGEWICVFDAFVRYGRPSKLSWDDEEEVDPLTSYGLDSDPPRPPASEDGTASALPGVDLIRWQRGDETWPDRQRLVGWHGEWTSQLPPRLYHLARWLSRVMAEPETVWWAAGNPQPHPGLITALRDAFNRTPPAPEIAKHFWGTYLEAAGGKPSQLRDTRSFEFREQVHTHGWTNATLRAFERISQPFFEISRPLGGGPVPPALPWAELNLYKVVQINVAVAPWDDSQLTVPAAVLPQVVETVRRSLQRMAQMLEESTSLYWRTPTLHPTGERGEDRMFGRKSGYFLWFASLFDRLLAENPAAAVREAAAWDASEPYFFAKLFLYAATRSGAIAPDQFVGALRAMPNDVFWAHDNRRELLFAVREQWPLLDAAQRRDIERRFARGRPWRDDNGHSDRRRRRLEVAVILRWLELQGFELTAKTARYLATVIAAEAEWDDSWARTADDSMGPRGGFIERVTATQGLEQLPAADIVTAAESLSSHNIRELRDFRPFDGLVASFPLKAISGLRAAARRGEYPSELWHSLMSNWPDGSTDRLLWFAAETLSRLPDEAFLAIRFSLPQWLQKQFNRLVTYDRNRAFRIFDRVVDRFMHAPPEDLGSSVGTTTIGGVIQDRSEVSISKAINAPGGELAECLFPLLKGRRGKRFPAYLRNRAFRLYQLPGAGGGHAAAVTARRLSWIEYWDAGWAQAMLPWFEVTHPLSEAMWHGAAHDPRFLTPAAETAIKSAYLAVLSGDAPWEMDRSDLESLFRRLPWLATTYGGPVVSLAEARSVLVRCSDRDRSAALASLAMSLSKPENWLTVVKPFIAGAWPRQLRYLSEATSRDFARIAEESGEHFPDAVETVLPLVRPVRHLDLFGYRLRNPTEDGNDHARKYPQSVLALLNALVGDDPATIPWQLKEILDVLLDAEPALRLSDAWRRLKSLT